MKCQKIIIKSKYKQSNATYSLEMLKNSGKMEGGQDHIYRDINKGKHKHRQKYTMMRRMTGEPSHRIKEVVFKHSSEQLLIEEKWSE